MTVLEYITNLSSLPKDGTYTMLEHLQAIQTGGGGTINLVGSVIINRQENLAIIDKTVQTVTVQKDKKWQILLEDKVIQLIITTSK